MQRADAEAQQAEQLCTEARSAMQAMAAQNAASAEEEKRVQTAHEASIHAMTTATAAALTSARDGARRAEENAQKALAARCERLVALRAKVDTSLHEASAAEAEALRAADAKQL